MTEYFERENLPKLAYVYRKGENDSLPTVMFLGGFRSDMEGTKALYFEQQCAARGQTYLRFDYSGHGISGGTFEEGTIGQWADDALVMLDTFTSGTVILVGSSMGGWISLLLALKRPERVAGLVGIAAAPDFTKDIEAVLNEGQKQEIMTKGRVELPNDYSDEPYVFTRALIEDGSRNCVLDKELNYAFPVRLVQGMQDTDVPWQTAFRIKNAVIDDDVEVILVESGDHRLSTPENLTLIDRQIQEISGVLDDGASSQKGGAAG